MGRVRKAQPADLWASTDGLSAVTAVMKAKEDVGEIQMEGGKYPVGILKSVRKAEFAKLDDEARESWKRLAQDPIPDPKTQEELCVTGPSPASS